MPRASSPSPKPKRVPARTRLAYHEAGHAVLGAAINDRPEYVTIEEDGERLGHSRQKMFSRPAVIAQVFVAGFAAEHILTGRRSREFDREIGFAILARDFPKLGVAFPGSDQRDGHGAVKAILNIATYETEDEIKREADRFYEIAKESLVAVWPAVEGVVKALLKRRTLDREGLDAAIGETDIYRPVYAVQKKWGLVPGSTGSTGEVTHACPDSPRGCRSAVGVS